MFASCTQTEKSENPAADSAVPDISWTSSGLDSCQVLSLVFLSDNSLFAGTNYGLYKSADNGQSWNFVNQDVSENSVTCFCIRPDGYVLAGTSSKGIFISGDYGENWTCIGLLGIAVSSIAVNSKNIIFAGTVGDGIYVSDALYEEWTKVSPGAEYLRYSSLLINTTDVVFAGATGVYRSNDNGKTWSLKNKGMGNWPVYSLIYDRNGNLAAGTDLGGFFRSEDSGESWIRLNKGLTNTEITALAINNEGYIFTGTWRGGVYLSTDNGENWNDINSGLINMQIYTLAVSPDNYLFAGTLRGIFRTKLKLYLQ
ncbi:MAG: hypothetical protein WAM24_19410 [Ignavibacteriaceae bacterium]